MTDRCPNGLTPDGPVCPRCGGERGPSGIDGGTWVHTRFDPIDWTRSDALLAECKETVAKFDAAKCVSESEALQNIEQYRMQMAAISTAAIGYWKEGDSIHPDYDTVALRDVARLYAKYAELYAQAADNAQEPFASGSLPELPKPTEMWTTHDSIGRAVPAYGYTANHMHEYARQSVYLVDQELLGFAQWLLDAYHSDEGMPEAKEIAKEARAVLALKGEKE